MDNKRAKLITLYELGYITDIIDIDAEYKQKVENVIFTKEYTPEQKNSLLEHYNWYYDQTQNVYIHEHDCYTYYTMDAAFEILKEELKEELKGNEYFLEKNLL